jgi:hypothetical protein
MQFTLRQPSPLQVAVTQPSGSLVSSQSGFSGVVSIQSSQVRSVNGLTGDVVIESPQLWPAKPAGSVLLTTTLNSGSFSLQARTTTGRFAVLWWDGIVQTFGTGVASSYHSGSKSVGTTGSAPKSVFVWCEGGLLVGLSCSLRQVTALDASKNPALQFLTCDTNLISHINISECPELRSLVCYGNQIRELRLGEATQLLELYCQSNLLAKFDVTKNPALQTLQCNNNLLETLDVSKNPALGGLFCHANQLRSLDLRGNLLLKTLNCSGNLLTSVRATGLAMSGPLGVNLQANSLSAAGLNTFYTDLAPVSGGIIYVAGNPGTAGDNPGIATSKGYTVVG